MKTKMVIWGSNEKDEKILLALELLHEENKVQIHAFPAASVTEVFYNQMMNLWRNGGPVTFPEDAKLITRELSMTADLLPEDIRVERTDLINRAKTEWHFVVLSSKLRESYNSEIQDFKDKIGALTNFDPSVWDDLKNFWDKVQNQIREKNLFREHANELRDNTNELFTTLKGLKKTLNEEFSKVSKEHVNSFMTVLKTIEQKVNDGLGLHPLFNELKDLQQQFNNTDFTRSDRSTVWKKLDATFKLVKEKKFGPAGKDNNSFSRINSRYNGLMSAINKMENSIHRDKKDIEFQNKRIHKTEGQLEMQIRQAKLSMIEQRIGSKEEKLAEMMRTKEFIEKKLEQEKKKQQKREEQQAAKKQKEATPKADASANSPEKTTDKPSAAPAAKAVATMETEEPIKPAAAPEAKADTAQETEKPKEPAAAPEAKADVTKESKVDAAKDSVVAETPAKQSAKQDTEATQDNKSTDKDPSTSRVKEENKAAEKASPQDSDSTDVKAKVAAAGAAVVAGATVIAKDDKPATITEAIEDITETIEDAVEDVFDTVKAAASVLMDKVEDVVESLTEEE